MKAFEGYRLITPDELAWRPSNLMRIPNADYLERTGSEIIGAAAMITLPNLSIQGGTTRLDETLTNSGVFSLGVPATWV